MRILLSVKTMRKPVQIIYFFKFFATGVIIPVLSLMLLSRGATIETISLVIGVYSVTVILAEFPSGIFADVYGRKYAFLLSCMLCLISYCAFLFSRSALVLLLGMVANGLGRAFSSGSIEALMIDQAIELKCPLERVTARLSILESAGLACGALAGGLMAEVGTRFSGNLSLNIGIYALLIILTAVLVQEEPRGNARSGSTAQRSRISVQMKESLSFLRKKGTVPVLLVFFLATGFALNAIEIYWQPALDLYKPAYWVFGVVSFAGFGFVMLGSWVAERILRRRKKTGIGLLLLLKTLFGAGLVLFSVSGSPVSLVGVYLLLYLFIGGSGVVENTFLNHLAPASQRASILSLFSFVLQIGGVLASMGGFFVSAHTRFQNMWLLAGILLLSISGTVGFFHKKMTVPVEKPIPENAETNSIISVPAPETLRLP